MFIPKTTNNTVVLTRSYETRDGTYTRGHRFERLPETISDHMHGTVTLRDSDGRTIVLTHYELERLT